MIRVQTAVESNLTKRKQDSDRAAYELAFKKSIENFKKGNLEMQECLQEISNNQNPIFKHIEDVLYRQLDILKKAQSHLYGWGLADTELKYPVEEFESSIKAFITELIASKNYELLKVTRKLIMA